MKYDIEADWHLLDTCNYSCSYCFFGPEVLKSKLRKYAAPSDWQSAFDVTGNIWLLHMTGGEPSIYSDFAELCEAKSEYMLGSPPVVWSSQMFPVTSKADCQSLGAAYFRSLDFSTSGPKQ